MSPSILGRSTRVLSALRLAFLLAVAPGMAMAAQTAEGPPGMTLPEVIQLAIRANPALAGQQYAIAEAAARQDQAALRPALTLGADIENVLGTGRIGAFDSMESTLRLGTVIELGAKRALRMSAAAQGVTSASLQRDIQALDLLALVTRRFIGNLAAQEKAEIAREHVERAQYVLDSVRLRVDAGVGSPLEEGNATVHLREMEIAQSAAAAELRRSWSFLAATWGAPPDGAGRAAGALHVLPALAEFGVFAAKLENNPHVARFAAERAAAEARLALARAGRTPDIAVSAGVRRLEAFNDQAVVMGFSVPLQAAARNAAAEREAQARLSHAASGEDAARLDNRATLFGLYEDARQARATFNTLRDSSLPVAEQTMRRAEEGFRAGRFSLFEVAAAQEQFHATEEAIVDAAETYHQAIAELERLTNEPFELPPAASQGVTP